MTAAVYFNLGWGLIVAVIAGASLRGLARFHQLPASLRCLTVFACFETFI